MKKKSKFKQLLSGMMAAIMIMTNILSPVMAYAEGENYPSYESVKDSLDADEVVTARDLELEHGTEFHVDSDFTGLEIKDAGKVKVSFHSAKDAAGMDFNTSHSGSYKTIYYVEPVNTAHPKYQVSRMLIVKEPITEVLTGSSITDGAEDEKMDAASEEGEPEPQQQTEMNTLDEVSTEEVLAETGETNTFAAEVPESEVSETETAMPETSIPETELELPEISETEGETAVPETSEDETEAAVPETFVGETEAAAPETSFPEAEMPEGETEVLENPDTEEITEGMEEMETEEDSEPLLPESEGQEPFETETQTGLELPDTLVYYSPDVDDVTAAQIEAHNEEIMLLSGETFAAEEGIMLTATSSVKSKTFKGRNLIASMSGINRITNYDFGSSPNAWNSFSVGLSTTAKNDIKNYLEANGSQFDDSWEKISVYCADSDHERLGWMDGMGQLSDASMQVTLYDTDGDEATIEKIKVTLRLYPTGYSWVESSYFQTMAGSKTFTTSGAGGTLRIAKRSDCTAEWMGRNTNYYVSTTFSVYDEASCTDSAEVATVQLQNDKGDPDRTATADVFLPEGQYWIKEISRSPGHQNPDGTIYGPFTITTGETTKTKDVLGGYIINYGIFAGLNINKKDQNGTAVADCIFKVTGSSATMDEGKTFTWFFKTDASGAIYYDEAHLVSSFDGTASDALFYPRGTSAAPALPVRMNLTVTEVYAPENYIMDSTQYSVATGFPAKGSDGFLPTFYTKKLDIQNQLKEATVQIIKTDAARGTALAGAVFGIYSDAACTSLITQMPATDVSGASSVKLNVMGTVYLKEITAPRGYKYSTQAHGVTLVAGQTVTKSISNTEMLGSLKIYKEGQVLTGAVSSADETIFQYGTKRLAGAVYEVRAAANIIAADGTLIFQKGEVVANEVVTGSDGCATVSNLHFGQYTVTEIKAPDNYVNKDETKIVTITSDNPMAETVLTEVVFTNDRQKASVIAAKQAVETSTPLSGAVFGLFAGSHITNADGVTVVTKDTLLGKVTTGNDGHGTFGTDLPVGFDYYMKELQAPNLFLLNGTDVCHFTFRFTNDTEAVQKFTYTFTNEEPRGELVIYKEGEVLAGAEVTEQGTVFRYEKRKQPGTVYDVFAGADIKTATGKLIYQKGAVVAQDLTTGADGSVKLSDLYLGTYTIREKNAPQNFVCKGEEQNVTLSYQGQTISVVMGETMFTNDRQKAAVTVKKVDDTTKNVLSGGIYGLYAAEDILNTDGITVVPKDTFIEKVTTGTDGTATYQSDLPIGNSYYIKELQAPDNYVRNTQDVYSFTFSYTHDTENVVSFNHTFENARVNAKIYLVKVDKETGEPQGDAVLEKAVYGLYAREDIVHPDRKTGVLYQEGTQVATLTTDEEGKAEIGELYLGKYYIRELTPSNGYLLDEAEYDLSCDFEGDLVATVERTATSKEQVIKQPFQIIKAANDGNTDAELLSGVGFTAYLLSELKQKEDGSYDTSFAQPVVLGENGATEIFTNKKGHAVSIALPFGTYLVRETTTPENFKPVKDFVVRITENHPTEPQVWRILLDEKFKAKLKITKQDDETKKPVLAADTEFKVFDVGAGKYVEQITTYPTTVKHTSYFTDSDGYLILPDNLNAGTYRIEEVTAPEGYTINRNYVEVKVESDAMYQIHPSTNDVVIEVVYENHPVKGELHILKKGEVLSGYGKSFEYEEQPLAGAVFEVRAAEDIYTADFQKDEQGERICEYRAGDLVTEVITDQEGMTVVSDLPLGTYTVQETKAPEGYVHNTEVQTVTFSYADQETPVIIQKAEFMNDRQKVEITAWKKDAQNEAPLSGALFELYTAEEIKAGESVLAEKGTLLGTAVTGEDGCAGFDADLPFGSYYVKESKAPAGYVSSGEIHEVTAAYQGQEMAVAEFSTEFHNEPTKVEITKSDIISGEELDGARLTVLDQEQNVVDTWTSVKGEPHVIERLHIGETYILREEFAPYGYLRATDVEFTISDTEEVQRVEMKDEVPTALLIINKKGEFLDKVTFLESTKGTVEHFFGYIWGDLAEVTFEVYAAEDIKAADGISEDYYKKDALVTVISTDSNGIAQAKDLPVGKYYVKEAETAHGYVLDGEERYIDLSYRNQDTPVVTYDEAWQNARQKVRVSVLKNEKGTERVLPGGVFGLYTAEDIASSSGEILMKADTLIEQRMTDEKGQLTFSADLPVDGTYYVQEICAPSGFVTTKEKQEFTFAYAGADKAESIFEFVFENEATTVEITKSDLTTGAELPGAKLKVTDEAGNTVDEWISGDKPHVIKELETGKTYTLTEVIPADGYVTAESIVFTVENTAELQKVEMQDDVTKVLISKTDMTEGGSEVEGAKLYILNENNEVTESWISGKEPHYMEKLPIGTYTLLEEAAPRGYLISGKVTFEVKDTGEVQSVQMVDDQARGRILLNKMDKESGKPMKGVTFTLCDSKGNVLETLVTDSTGHAESQMYPIAVFENGVYCEAITYILKETKTLDGYALDETEHKIVFEYLDDQTPVVEIQMEVTNGKVKEIPQPETPQPTTPQPDVPTGTYVPDAPKTGDETNILLYVAAMFIAFGSTITIVKMRKKRNK